MRASILLFLLASAAAVWPLSAPPHAFRSGPVEVELMASQLSIRPGEQFTIALRLSMDPGWHTYWRNPGDSGLPTAVDWLLPKGFTADLVEWPVPAAFKEQDLTTFGYSGEALLAAAITPPADLMPGSTVALRARVSWLACRVECLPGSAEVSLVLPVRTGAPLADPRGKRALDAARTRMPVRDASVSFTVRPARGFFELRADGLRVPSGLSLLFAPDTSGFIELSAPQPVASDGSGVSLRLKSARAGAAPSGRLQGLLLVMGGAAPRGLAVDAPFPVSGGGAGAGLGIALALAFAFLGGILLNLMPCVLPVLSLKVVSLLRNSHSTGRGALAHGLVFSAGVLVSFWLIAGVLLALRAAGPLLGWGFQFQSPGLVAGVAVLFFLVGLNLFGVFELGTGAAAAAAGVRSRGGWAGSFASGLLATAVATPCTAPFMGSALGYALSRPPAAALAVFTALGLGMSLPYLLLSAAPGLVKRIPRPGRWMETLKQAMGFPMMAAVVWMGSVLIALSGAASLLFLLGALVASGIGAWVWGRWGGIDRPRGSRRAAVVIAFALVAAGAALAISQAETGRAAAGASGSALPATPRSDGMWETWSPERVAELLAAGRPVFIDFSAQWCLTCQVNERVALRRGPVERRFRELGVAALKADWTDRSVSIAAAIAGYGRAGVPLYVLYGPGGEQPVLLPELLTPRIVLDALDAMR